MNNLLSVSRDDLKSVTEAVLDNWIEQYTSGGGWEHTVCRFCKRDQAYDYKCSTVIKPDHAPDCPVLIAISIQPHD